MSIGKVGASARELSIAPTRQRETPRPQATFSSVLRGSASVLLSGAQAFSSIVGGPFLSAAVGQARAGVDAASRPANTPGAETDPLKSLSEDRMSDELQLLALQQEIQRRDRQISMISNVMKARHDTAKAAIGNLRS